MLRLFFLQSSLEGKKDVKLNEFNFKSKKLWPVVSSATCLNCTGHSTQVHIISSIISGNSAGYNLFYSLTHEFLLHRLLSLALDQFPSKKC